MKRTTVVVLMVILVLSVFALYGCPKSADVSSAPESQPQKVEKTPDAAAAEEAKAAEEKKASEATAAAAAATKAAEDEKAEKERAAKEAGGLKAIYFDFDKSFVRDDAKAVMKANAAWLKANPKAKVRIEGNCDERGTIEYNQALGQRRAASAKKYLTDLGISGKRISLISYGKEKPVCKESTEDCWQQNRRADLIAAE
jgi:peptidoglycan-associated lipoprotein